jgi:hypothetical protein
MVSRCFYKQNFQTVTNSDLELSQQYISISSLWCSAKGKWYSVSSSSDKTAMRHSE